MSRNFAFFLFLGLCLVASRVVDCQEGTEDQSVNENPGDQSVNEAQGDQSVNEVPEDQSADDVADPVPDDQPADDVGSESTNSPHEITEPDASGDGQASEDHSAPTEAPGDQSVDEAPTESPDASGDGESSGASENEKKEEEEEPAVVPDGDGSGDVNNDSNHSNSTEVAVEDNSDHVDDQSKNNPGGRDEVPTESPPEDTTSAPENVEDETSKYLGDEYNFFMEHCSPSESVNRFGYELLYDSFINVLHIFYSDHALDRYNSNRTIQKYFGRDVYDQVFNDYANAHSLSEPLMSCPENVEEKFKKSINEFIVHALSTLLTIYYYGTVSADDIQRIEETLSAGQQIDSLIDGYGQMSGVLMDLCRKCH